MLDYGDLEVSGKPLVSSMSGEVAVRLLHRLEKSQQTMLSLDRFVSNAKKEYTIKDLWSKETFKTSNAKEVVREVPDHNVAVLKMKGTSIPFNVFLAIKARK